jgi:hypothetical protein
MRATFLGFTTVIITSTTSSRFSLRLFERLNARNTEVTINGSHCLKIYGCETWSLTLREEHRLRVFENRVVRRMFGPKRDHIIGGWRKLHNEKLHNLYTSPSIIRTIN